MKRWNFKLSRFFVFFALSVLCSACASGPKFVKTDAPFPHSVAVLPMANETNDVTGPETVRKAMAQFMPLRGYAVQPIEKTDAILRAEFGITEGGQLGSVTEKELGEKLGVEGLVYGNILTFVDLPLGFVRKRSVKAEFKLVAAPSSEMFWQDEKSWISPEVYIDPKEAKIAFALMVTERQAEKIAGQFLRLESELMVLSALVQLPPGGPAQDDAFWAKVREKRDELRFRNNLRRSVLNNATK